MTKTKRRTGRSKPSSFAMVLKDTFALILKDMEGTSGQRFTPFAFVPIAIVGDKKLWWKTAGEHEGVIRKGMKAAAKHSDYIRERVKARDFGIAELQDAFDFLRDSKRLLDADFTIFTPDWWDSARAQVKEAMRLIPRIQLLSKRLNAVTPEGHTDEVSYKVMLGEREATPEQVEALREHGTAMFRDSESGKIVQLTDSKAVEILRKWDGSPKNIGRNEAVEHALAVHTLRESEGFVGTVVGDDDLMAFIHGRINVRQRARNAGFNGTLYKFQEQGVDFALRRHAIGRGCVIGDEMGVGKSPQAIAVLSILAKQAGRKGTDLVVAPKSLLDNWERELARFAPHLNVRVSHPDNGHVTLEDLDDVDVVVTNYERLAIDHWLVSEAKWRNVVVDEAHRLRTMGRQYALVSALTSEWKMALTGTPFVKQASDVFALMEVVNPRLFNREEFVASLKDMLKSNDFAPLRRRLAFWMIRRLKSDPEIGSTLPAKIIKPPTLCRMEGAQARRYSRQVKAEIAKKEAQGGKIDIGWMHRCKAICNTADSAKIEALVNIAENVRDAGERVLVFTSYVREFPILHAALTGVFGKRGLQLNGKMSPKKRGEAVARFQADEDVPYMVLSKQAGGEGITLHGANNVIIFDIDWTLAADEQAMDRAYRIGQERNVVVWTLVTKGTIEEKIAERQDEMRAERDGAIPLGIPNLSDMTLEDAAAFLNGR